MDKQLGKDHLVLRCFQWNGSDPGQSAWECNHYLKTPKGFHNKAQGCAAPRSRGATLGSLPAKKPTLKGLHSLSAPFPASLAIAYGWPDSAVSRQTGMPRLAELSPAATPLKTAGNQFSWRKRGSYNDLRQRPRNE